MATRTADEARRQRALAYDAYLRDCPARKLLERISDKWLGLVMSALAERPMRYSELSRLIAGVSQKMLTQTLRTLERDGLVARTVTASVPVRVDYELTPLGVELQPVMRAIKDWAEQYIEDVEEARAAYDARAAGDPSVARSG